MNYKYFLGRIIQSFLTMLGLIVLVFVLVRIVPGDPVRLALGPEATEEQIQAFVNKMGLDKSLPVQFYNFLVGLTQGKFGMSFMTYRDCSKDILATLPASFELVLVAVTIGSLGGIILGTISAVNQNKWIDQFTRLFSVTGVASPRFLIAILLQVIIGYWLGILPVAGRIESGIAPPSQITGLYLLDSLLTFNISAFESSLKSIALPAVTLATSPLASVTRLVRGNMLEEGKKNYVLQARANGLPRSVVTYKYMLKTAVTPALTTVGMAYVSMLGFAFVVETVFGWPGLASYGVFAALNKDINAMVGVAITMVVLFLAVNFIIDIIYAYLDPRITY